MEVKSLGDYRQFRHIRCCASGMRADEIGDNLLAQSVGTVDAVENLLELLEQIE